MDFVQSPMKPPSIIEQTCQNAHTCFNEEEDGDIEKCSCEKESDIRVAKIKEMLKPMQQTSKELHVLLTSKVLF